MTVHAEEATTAEAERLLDGYHPGCFFFSSPSGTVLGTGVRSTFTGAPDELVSRVPKLIADSGGDLVIGALPFDPAADPRIVVPETLRHAPPLGAVRGLGMLAVSSTGPVPGRCQVHAVPEPARHMDAVATAVTALESGELRKVVLARSLRVSAPAAINTRHALRNLASRDPNGHIFAMDLGRGVNGPYRTLIGASPELLVRKAGPFVVSKPVAGSAARSADPAEDERRGAALLSSAKDLWEHKVVIESMADVLAPYCAELTVPEPTLVGTEAVWHLGTHISGRLADPDTSSVELASALHPTPAICGWPVAEARAAIDDLEPFDRGFYAGTVGWSDANGDGEWAVTLRCGEVDEDELTLFAGGGIVLGSRPADELAETSAKFRTLLSAIGIDEA
ncbi:MAG: isochorismate synthase [Sciscionella sp.]